MHRARALAFVLLLAGAAAAAQPNPNGAAKKRVVCWDDEHGQRHCGDAVPPRYAAQERRVLDSQGRLVRTLPGQPTPEELAERRERERSALVEKRSAQQQAALDRALLETYTSAEEIAAARDDHLGSVDTRLSLALAALQREQKALAALRARMQDAQSSNPAQAKRAAALEAAVASQQATVDSLRAQRAQMCENSARDVRRFQELKTGAVAFSSPCPEEGSLSALRAVKADLSSARAFFSRWVELQQDYDAAFFELYAANALIERPAAKAGEARAARLDTAGLRKRLDVEWPAARAALERHTYADVSFEDLNDGRARITGQRRAAQKPGAAQPFRLVLKPVAGSWKIVEDVLEAPR